jgi:hypothetical protein
MPGCGSSLADPPLKRRSARKSAHVRIVPPVRRQCAGAQRLHTDRVPGSSPGAATISATPADRVIWRGGVAAVVRFECAVWYTGVL